MMTDAHSDDDAIRARLAACCKGITIADIARLTDCNAETVRRFVRQGKPSAVFLARFCREYRISPDWLILGVGSQRLEHAGETDLSTIETADLVTVLAQRLAVDRGAAGGEESR